MCRSQCNGVASCSDALRKVEDPSSTSCNATPTKKCKKTPLARQVAKKIAQCNGLSKDLKIARSKTGNQTFNFFSEKLQDCNIVLIFLLLFIAVYG